MSDQSRKTESKADNKAQHKVTPSVTSEQGGVADLAIAPLLPFQGGSLESQVAMLEELPSAQRNAMIQRISQVQGHRHVQRVIATLQGGNGGHAEKTTTPVPRLQTSLEVGEPDDEYEQEADEVAETVMRMSDAPSPPPPDGDGNSNKGGSPPHTSAAPFEEIQASGEGAAPVTPGVETRINDMRGTGTPLPDSERTFFESRFGADFGGVRLHTGDAAAQTAQDLNARAYTVGTDIAFNAGEYRPGSEHGRKLLAHELTHVVQQGGASELSGGGNGAQRQVQRQGGPEAAQQEVEEGPTEEEKAAAAVAAAAALAAATAAKAKGQAAETETRSEGEAEKAAAEGPRQAAAASLAAGPASDAAEKARQAAVTEKAEIAKQAFAAQAEAAQAATQTVAAQATQTAETAGGNGAGAQAAAAAGAAAAQAAETAGGNGADATGAAAAARVAVEAAMSREGGPDKAPSSPEEDPAYKSVSQATQAVAEEEQVHEPAKSAADAAQAAAESPASEVESKAQANQVGEMEQAETPGFDAVAFKEQLMQRIADLAPKSAEEADEFKESGKMDSVKGEMQGQVDQEREVSQGPLEEKASAEPDTGSVEPRTSTPLNPAEAGPAPGDVGARGATPKPRGQSEVETPLQESSQAVDQEMADAGVTEEQLEKSNEPEFQSALDAKHEAQASAAEAPQGYRQDEQGQIASSEAEAAATAQAALEGIHGNRATALAQVQQQQQTTKSEDEVAREKVAADIQSIYDETQTQVESTLAGLDSEVDTVFDEGAKAAEQTFEEYVDARMEAYKQERYGGIFGWAQWLADKVLGMPEEVNAFYDGGRNLYLAEMDAVINKVVAIVGKRLSEAKAAVAEGKQRIQEYVDGLPENLKAVGQQAAQDIQSRFDELEQTIDAKQNELIDTLANKYQENLQAIDARIEEMKAANKGLIGMVVDAVGGVIRTIIELKNALMGVLARVAEVIGAIFADPVNFFNNFITGLKEGFMNFSGNILQHLQQGFIAWLTGSLGEVGITLPENFDLQGIFQLVLQILGISWDQIKGKITKILGFDLFGVVDTIVEVVTIVQEEGMAGLVEYGLARIIGPEGAEALMSVWQMIQAVMSGDFAQLFVLVQEQLSGLKEMVIGQIISFITERVIKAGITWLLGMLNPAGALFKIVKALIDIVTFFIERADQIAALINAIIDSVAAAVAGDTSLVANMVENALAKAIPVAIGFLASLLGLGGISKKVKEIVEKVRGMVDKALDAVFNSKPVQMVAGFIRKIVGKVKDFGSAALEKGKGMLGFGEQEEDEVAETGDPEHDMQVREGLAAIDVEEKKYIEQDKISKEEAEQVAAKVKTAHPVFKSINVVDGGNTWDYKYVASPEVEVKGEKKEEGEGGAESILDEAIGAVEALMSEGEITVDEVKAALPGIKAQYGLVSLELILDDAQESVYYVEGAIEVEVEKSAAKTKKKRLHNRYKPQNLQKVKIESTGELEVTYKTSTGAEFKSVIGKDKMIKSITGTHLKIDPGRGSTTQSDITGWVSDAGMNRSHLIADQFTGSGYKRAANLIATSAQFNQEIMSAAERKIRVAILSSEVEIFNMTVSVDWAELNDAEANGYIQAMLKSAGIVDVDVSDIAQKLREANPEAKRCMNVNYVVTLTDSERNPVATLDPINTGPDFWLRT